MSSFLFNHSNRSYQKSNLHHFYLLSNSKHNTFLGNSIEINDLIKLSQSSILRLINHAYNIAMLAGALIGANKMLVQKFKRALSERGLERFNRLFQYYSKHKAERYRKSCQAELLKTLTLLINKRLIPAHLFSQCVHFGISRKTIQKNSICFKAHSKALRLKRSLKLPES